MASRDGGSRDSGRRDSRSDHTPDKPRNTPTAPPANTDKPDRVVTRTGGSSGGGGSSRGTGATEHENNSYSPDHGSSRTTLRPDRISSGGGGYAPGGNDSRLDGIGPGSGGIANLEDWNQLQRRPMDYASTGSGGFSNLTDWNDLQRRPMDYASTGSGSFSSLTDWNDLQRERRNSEIAGRSTRPGEGPGGYSSLDDWNQLQKPAIPDYGLGMAVQGAPDDFITHAPPGQTFADMFVNDLMSHNQENVAKRRAAGDPVWNPMTGFDGLGDALVQTPKPGDKSMGILDGFDLIANPNRPPDGGVSTYTPPNIADQLQQLNGGTPLPQRNDGLPINLGTLPVEDQVRYLHTRLTPEQAAGLPTNLDKFTPQQQVKYLTSMLTPSNADFLTNPAVGQPDVVGKDVSQITPNGTGDIADMAVAEQLGGISPFDANMFADAGSPYPASREVVPLPRVRPDHVVLPDGTPAPMGGAQNDDIWANMRTPGETVGAADPTALMGDASDAAIIGETAAPKKDPSLWDNGIGLASDFLSGSNIVGMAAKGLFPDLWSGAENALKGIDDNWGQPKDHGGGRGGHYPNGNEKAQYGDYDRTSGGTPPVVAGGPAPDPFLDSFPDLNNNGIDDRLEPDAPGVRTHKPNQRTVRFPGIPPYRPGRDNEFQYFGGNQYGNTIVPYADGGIVTYLAGGGDVGALARQDPRVTIIADAEDALAGHQEEPEKAIKKFVDAFGEEALKSLADQVHGEGLSLRHPPRLIEGKGGPKGDKIPAKIDNVHEARLSDGEFVMPADAVLGAGNGDRAQGAAALQDLAAKLAGSKSAPKALNVERVG